jgi:hypothetical protein
MYQEINKENFVTLSTKLIGVNFLYLMQGPSLNHIPVKNLTLQFVWGPALYWLDYIPEKYFVENLPDAENSDIVDEQVEITSGRIPSPLLFCF